MNGTIFYEAQERAMAPGIVEDWPQIISHPFDNNGRLFKLDEKTSAKVESLLYPKHDSSKLDAIMAAIRDICRHRYGSYEVPSWYVEKAVKDFKAMRINDKLIWPHESEATRDTWTGEVLYKPVSRRDLVKIPGAEAGILDWLGLYMIENGIPSNHPRDSIPGNAE